MNPFELLVEAVCTATNYPVLDIEKPKSTQEELEIQFSLDEKIKEFRLSVW